MVSEIWGNNIHCTGCRGEPSPSFPVFGSYAVSEGHEERPERGRYFLVCRLTAPLWRYILSCYDALTLRFLFLQSSEAPLRGKIKCLEALQHRVLDMSR
jgi:hypothetical protein